MSASDDGGKPAQLGLVDMGDIRFYDDPTYYPPSFNTSDLTSYTGSFSEMVLNVAWQQLQPAQGQLNTSVIDSALAAVNAYNTQNGTNLGIKLRVWGGYQAPEWAKTIDGPAVTITGQATVDPYIYSPRTIGRFWTADYNDAWSSLQNQLASRYDSNPLIRGISQTAGASATDEPFVSLNTQAATSNSPGAPTVNQINEVQAAGYTDAAQMLTLRAAIADYAQWGTTPLDFTMNPFHLFDSGNESIDPNFTLAVLQQARSSTRMVQAGNHALNYPTYSFLTFLYAQMTADAALSPAATQGSFQTDSPDNLAASASFGTNPAFTGAVADWPNSVANGMLSNGGNIELWNFSGPNNASGFRSLSTSQVNALAQIVANGVAPTTGAPDDGSALAFLAPAHVTGSPGTIAFSGTDAVLLESATQQGAYSATLTSLNGGTLAVTNVGGIVSSPASGSTLSFAGSLAQVNTVLASLRDTLAAGTDVVQITATDASGHTAVRTVGVQVAAAAAPTGGSSPGGGMAAFQGNGMLVVGGVQAAQVVAGNLQIGPGGNSTLLAALAPSAYSTASLTVGGTFEVLAGGTARITGTLGAHAVQVDAGSGGSNGGTLSGDGTLSALGGGPITNNGTIEAVADLTLGLQRLSVTNNITGTGTLAIDAGATLVLGGTVASSQTIQFAANTSAQFANGPYSPSTLALQAPLFMFGAISGFTFADRLVLEGVTANTGPGSLTGYDSATNTLTIQQQTGPTLTYTLSGSAPGDLAAYALNVGFQNGATVVSFVSPTSTPVAPSLTVPQELEGAAGVAVLVPNIVVNTPGPSPSGPAVSSLVSVTLSAASGTLSAGSDNGNTGVTGNNTGSIVLSGTLDSVERSLQTLTYKAAAAGTTSIDVFVSDWAGISTTSTIHVFNNAAPLQFTWNNANGGNFGDLANWTAAGHSAPPGGANIAAFGAGTYTVTGDGAVAQIVANGTTTLTGQVTAQGRGGLAMSVDGGGALTLAGGAQLAAEQEAIVGEAGQGLLVVMGGALDLNGPAAANALIVGQQSGSSGTVVNLEQITANGTVIVGGSGTGTLELLGVASSVSDAGADIGQFAGGRGSVMVNGGEWMNGGQLTVGDAGTGSLLINGTSGGTTGQVTAFNATIGNQAGGQGSVTLNAGELLIANVAAASNTLAVGGSGTGELAVEGGSEVAVGVVQGTVANNGQLVVGGIAGGQGRVRIGGNSALLVYGSAAVGAAGASTRASAAYANSAAANGTATGTITVGESADDIALFSLLGTLSVTGAGQVALGGSHATVRASAVDIAQGGAISGAGTLSGLGGGNRTVTLASIDNEGAILASGGNLLLYGAVGGTGTLLVDTNATMTLQAAVGSGQVLAFGRNATAVLNDARAFAGTITGFGAGDVLDIAGTNATSAVWSNGVLTLGTALGDIRLFVSGNYASNAFTVQADGLGGTNVTGGTGDVHMVTFDGLHYDFQAVGDFVAVRSTQPGNPWQFQIRTAAANGAASITTGLAAVLGDDRVTFAVGRDNPVYIDGAPDTALQVGASQSLAGGTLTRLAANAWRVSWNTGESVTVAERAGYDHGYFDWSVALGPQDGPGSVQGLLGSNSGQAMDFQLPDGSVLAQPLSEEQILGAFADAWRVTPGGSLFDDRSVPTGSGTALLLQYMSAMGDAAGAPLSANASHDPNATLQETNLLAASAHHPA